VTTTFNPYDEWLGIGQKVTSYYQLIGVRDLEPDIEKIRLAADRAITRVRGHRPGEHAAQWAQLLDLLKRIKGELTDPQSKLAYDKGLRPDKAAALEASAKKAAAEKGGSHALGSGAAVAAKAQPTAANAAEEPDFAPEPAAEWDPMAPVDPHALPTPTNTASVSSPQSQWPASSPVAPQEPSAASAPLVKVAKRGKPQPSTPLVLVGGICLGVLLTVAVVLLNNQLGLFGSARQTASNDNKSEGTGQNSNGQQNQSAANSTSSQNNSSPTTAASTTGAKSSPQSTGNKTPDQQEQPADTATPESDPSATEDMPADDTPETPSDDEPESDAPDTTPATTTDNNTTPEPDPDSDPKPEPEPEPEPESTPDTSMASAEELKALSEALIAARTALQSQEFEEAEKKLADAEASAKSDDHKAMVARLKMAADYLKQFRAAVDRAMKGLEAGVTFQAKDDVMVAVVERKPDAIVVKVGSGNVGGRNQTYQLKTLPLVLGVALADQGLQGNEDAPLIKGVFQALHAKAQPNHIDEVRRWWEKAGDKGAELLPLLDDQKNYEAIANPSETTTKEKSDSDGEL